MEGKARANSFLGKKLLVLPANDRLDLKVIVRYKHNSLMVLIASNKEKSFIRLPPGANVVKLFTAVIYEFSL